MGLRPGPRPIEAKVKERGSEQTELSEKGGIAIGTKDGRLTFFLTNKQLEVGNVARPSANQKLRRAGC